ncbi:MAG: MFS transporter [Bacteroidales bacterium]|nr:MFS transporter [Bacteroidales bacterium]
MSYLKNIKIKFDSEIEKKTFYLHLIYSILDGIILGILALNEYVLIKGLKGSSYQIGMLFQFTVIVLLVSVPLNLILKRTVKKIRMLRLVAIFTRAPLLLLLFFPETVTENTDILFYQIAFLIIFLIYFSANPLIMPAINGFLKTNYKHGNFSKLYGYSATVNKIVMLVATFLFGILLDKHANAYTYVYPFLALLGIVSIFILTQIKYSPPVSKKQKMKESLKEIKANILHIIKTNKPFRDFEIGFMFYGLAWLVTIAVIALFLEYQLKLNYSGIAFYKNFYTTVSILLTPLFGKLLGKINPRKFGIYTFLFMLIYILFMGLTEYFPYYTEVLGVKIYYSLLVSFFAYGIFGAMMGLLWYIGSAYFAKDEDAAEYQSIHLSLTGFRGAFAPLVGVLFFELIGYSGVFAIGIISLLIAIFVLRYSLRKYK